jgi:hypothetical protein
MLELVYKVTERAGVTLFEPRPFWQLNNYARSGSAADPSKVPPGAEIVHGVYATRGSFIPFYFAPRHCPRFSIDPRAEENALPVLQSWFGPFPRQSSRLIVFLDADRDALTRAAFSVYAFDVRCFRMLPTREYFADAAVTPIREERHTNALTAIGSAGWAIRFVADLDALRRLRADVQAAGVTRFSAEKMEGSLPSPSA